MNSPLITVIIPVFNVEEYLEECLDSVVNQTYTNIEIITINDGSTDKSLKILEYFASKNKNITIISQENSGQSVARNKGIEIANGKYIYFLDADDYILPETFEHLIPIMEEKKLDLIRFSAESFVDKIGDSIKNNRYDFSKSFEPNKVYNKEEFLEKCFGTFSPSPVLYVVKKDLLINNNILFKPGIIHEDELFTLEVFLNTNATMYSPYSFYMRRYRANSTMTAKSLTSRKKSFNSRCIILDELGKLLKKYNNKNEIKLIRKRIRAITTLLIYHYPDLDKQYIKKKISDLDSFSIIDYLYCVLRKKFVSIYNK